MSKLSSRSKWIEIYRSKRRSPESEAWACAGCGAQEDKPHAEGPSNGLCRCENRKIVTASDLYRKNWRLIKWNIKES